MIGLHVSVLGRIGSKFNNNKQRLMGVPAFNVLSLSERYDFKRDLKDMLKSGIVEEVGSGATDSTRHYRLRKHFLPKMLSNLILQFCATA